ncbi:MAG: dihydrolipoamide succinyltransferase, partial [bacterium]
MHFALLAGACAKARAATVPDGPPLQVPEPPPRVLAPVEEATVATPAPAPEPPAAAPRTPPRP